MNFKRKLLLLITQRTSQELLTGMLVNRYEIVLPGNLTPPAGEFDIIIVDDPAHQKHHRWIAEQKQKRSPVFLPVVLLTDDAGVDQAGIHSGKTIDELILLPVNKTELLTRLAMMEKVMNLSLRNPEFAGKNELPGWKKPGSIDAMPEEITIKKSHYDQLIRDKEKAEERNRLKSAFLQNISHEIRTPMNGILGFMELISNQDLCLTDQEEFLQIVNKSARRLMHTMDDLATISGIESGINEITWQEVNIWEMLQFHADFFKSQIHGKNIVITLSYQPVSQPDVIITDKIKFSSILFNLISNAVKFTAQGSIEIGYKPGEGYFLFYVHDTGSGIPADRQQAIFEPYLQAGPDSSYTHESAGLGLSISKAYTEMLHGDIWVESSPHVGSTFYFTLPVNPTIQTSVPGSGGGFHEAGLMKKTLNILVAEDDDSSYFLIKKYLESFNFQLLRAKNGAEAVLILKRNPTFDLVLMDLKMPVMNGFEATRQIRQFNKTIPIIAQTAHALVYDKMEADKVECNAFIAKPINRSELLHLINKCTEVSKGGAASSHGH